MAHKLPLLCHQVTEPLLWTIMCVMDFTSPSVSSTLSRLCQQEKRGSERSFLTCCRSHHSSDRIKDWNQVYWVSILQKQKPTLAAFERAPFCLSALSFKSVSPLTSIHEDACLFPVAPGSQPPPWHLLSGTSRGPLVSNRLPEHAWYS